MLVSVEDGKPRLRRPTTSSAFIHQRARAEAGAAGLDTRADRDNWRGEYVTVRVTASYGD